MYKYTYYTNRASACRVSGGSSFELPITSHGDVPRNITCSKLLSVQGDSTELSKVRLAANPAVAKS